MKYFLIILLAAVFGYFATIFLTPYSILLFIKFNSGSKMNVPVFTEEMTDKDRHVVMPNPDFLYTACGYNLWGSAIRVSGKLPENTYGSIALYADNTLNYYIKNDRQAPDKSFDFILTRNKKDIEKYPGKEVIVSPSGMGTILTRILIDKPENIEELKKVQRSIKVEKLQ